MLDNSGHAPSKQRTRRFSAEKRYDVDAMVHRNVNIPPEMISAFCRKWNITEFALFGAQLLT